MIHQHPAIVRAAALKTRFYAQAPQAATPVSDAEIDTTPASQLDIEVLAAEQEYLEYDAFLNENPFEYCADAAERAADLYANWQCLLAYQAKAVPSFTVTTQPHPDHGKRGSVTVRNFTNRSDAESYAAFFGRSTIVARPIVPCSECGGHGSDSPKRIHWTNPNNIMMRCGRCGGDGEEPELPDYDENDYPDNDPSL